MEKLLGFFQEIIYCILPFSVMYNPLKLIFRDSAYYLGPLIDGHECPASALKLLGLHLIVRNVGIAISTLSINSVMIPDKYRAAIKLVQDNFPQINIEEYYNDCTNRHDLDESKSNSASDSNSNNHNITLLNNVGAPTYRIKFTETEKSFEVPLNAVLHCPNSLYSNTTNILVDTIVYPWDFLNIVHKTLNEEITGTRVSKNASIAKTSIIQGPCVIEDDVVIDDFCKIKGPTYIGKGSFIGMSSLIRQCMFSCKTRIGFNCEVGKSYFAGDDRIAHQNVILDSIIGNNVWFGGYSGTANVLLNRKNVKYDIGDGAQLVDTGMDHFGAVVGNNCAVGASVIILPGRMIPSSTVIQAGTVVGKKLSSEEIYLGKTDRVPLQPKLHAKTTIL